MQWSWESVKDGALAALNGPMKKLENALKLSDKNFPITHRVQTTNGSATTIATLAIPVNHTVYVRAFIVARRTGGSSGSTNDGAAYRLEVACKNTAGTAAEIAAETMAVIGEDQAAWTVASSASGGNLLLQVTGAANNTVSWKASVKTLAVKDEE